MCTRHITLGGRAAEGSATAAGKSAAHTITQPSHRDWLPDEPLIPAMKGSQDHQNHPYFRPLILTIMITYWNHLLKRVMRLAAKTGQWTHPPTVSLITATTGQGTQHSRQQTWDNLLKGLELNTWGSSSRLLHLIMFSFLSYTLDNEGRVLMKRRKLL